MLEGLRKFILGESAIIALLIVAIVAILHGTEVSPHVCYGLVGIATGVGFANALKAKNGKN